MIISTATMIVDESQITAQGRAKTPRATNGGGVGRGSNDGCCDNFGSRAKDLIDKVPPCTGKLYKVKQKKGAKLSEFSL